MLSPLFFRVFHIRALHDVHLFVYCVILFVEHRRYPISLGIKLILCLIHERDLIRVVDPIDRLEKRCSVKLQMYSRGSDPACQGLLSPTKSKAPWVFHHLPSSGPMLVLPSSASEGRFPITRHRLLCFCEITMLLGLL